MARSLCGTLCWFLVAVFPGGAPVGVISAGDPEKVGVLLVREVKSPGSCSWMALSKSGKEFLLCRHTRRIDILDANTYRLKQTFSGAGDYAAFMLDDSAIAASTDFE